MQAAKTQRDIAFRKFQIMKFNIKKMVPAVTMTVNVDVSQILKLKDNINNKGNNTPHVTVTHIIMKAVADTLVQYPVLYSFFNGNDIVENAELILNIPVDVESHVEYITIHSPESKSLPEIAAECREELNCIHSGNGTFMKFLLTFNKMSVVRKMINFWGPDGAIRFLREHYGNFPISNFGSFHINSGVVVICQPMIAGLCIGLIVKEQEHHYMPLTLTFDHRAVDGAYAGKFLYSVRTLLEKPDPMISDGR
jgi:pyruvate dehydrogenase E2 component (dihydrolipoamide acetyltransferase)